MTPPCFPYCLLNLVTRPEKKSTVPPGHRENRDLMHISSEDLFGDPLHVRGEKGEWRLGWGKTSDGAAGSVFWWYIYRGLYMFIYVSVYDNIMFPLGYVNKWSLIRLIVMIHRFQWADTLFWRMLAVDEDPTVIFVEGGPPSYKLVYRCL